MVSKFPYLGGYRSMKKTHKSFFFMSMIDNIIPVSIALGKVCRSCFSQNTSQFLTIFIASSAQRRRNLDGQTYLQLLKTLTLVNVFRHCYWISI